MPSKKSRTGEFIPVVSPLSKELYAHIRRKVLDEFKRIMESYDEEVCSFD